MELNSEDVKESISKTLLNIFPNANVYKEASSSPKYPNFFIRQINVSDREERRNYHILTYNMDIRYRTTSDPSTDLKLEQNLDDVGLKLLANFNTIDFDDSKIKCLDKSIEKQDGVLHFFTNFEIMVKLCNIDEEIIKQNNLALEVKYG